jgi:hypothetical protein
MFPRETIDGFCRESNSSCYPTQLGQTKRQPPLASRPESSLQKLLLSGRMPLINLRMRQFKDFGQRHLTDRNGNFLPGK